MRVAGCSVTLACLIEANLVPENTKLVKIILSGKVTKPFTIKDKVITATKGAKSAVESAGGKFEV
jgi:large subunit ribosomal protein L15